MNIIKAIKTWVRARNIHTAHPNSQFLKVVEEVGELAGALARGEKNKAKDAIGDTVVTLIAISETLNFDLEECIKLAYEEIKDRKGKMVDGVFIKEEDLNE